MEFLENLSVGRRFALALGIVLVIVSGVFLAGRLVNNDWSEAEAQLLEPQLYEGIPLDSTLLKLDKQALDEAYTRYVARIFDVWLQGNLADDERARAGFKKARAARNAAARQIAQREQELLKQDRQQQNKWP